MSFLGELTPHHAQCVRWNEEEEVEDKEFSALLPVLRQGAPPLQGTMRLLQSAGTSGPYNNFSQATKFYTYGVCDSLLGIAIPSVKSHQWLQKEKDEDEYFTKSHVWQHSWISSRSLLRKHLGCLEPGYLPVFPGRFCNFLGTKFRQGWMVTDIHSGSPLGCVFANRPGCSTNTPWAWTH